MVTEDVIITDNKTQINDEDKLIDCVPFPNQCHDEVKDIESFYSCFQQRYNACPAFYTGSLSSACESAFNSTIIKERRPVLVYIHNDKSMLNNIFCKTTFCSEIIIDYLLENYIVSPWNITFEWNKNKIIEMWEEIFSNQLFRSICAEECPILIGIMRRSAKEKDWTSISEYQFKLLVKGNTLTRTGEKFNPKTLWNELAKFKKECDDNEQDLSFDFVGKTGLCLEIVLEITKYLSLNDTMNAFSETILPSLYKYNTKVQICEPSKGFVNLILRKLNPEQIVCLHISPERRCSNVDLSCFVIFTNIHSISLVNPWDVNEINKYIVLFPKLNCVSLWYNYGIGFGMLSDILERLDRPMRRFEIHCAGISCSHYHCRLNEVYRENLNVKYFVFDVGCFSTTSIIDYVRENKSCILLSIINFVKSLKDIRYVRVITNKFNVNELLNWSQWKTLMDICPKLKRVTIEILQSVTSGEQLAQKVMEINKVLTITQ